jgi:hypothetical protein
MNYFVKRGDQEYGPYTLAVLQQYVSQGNISKDDMARSEAMSDWVPVSSILGNIAVSAATGSTGFGVTAPMPVERPLPPNLHWALVVVLGIVTFGIFWIIWAFVQAAWVRKVVPKSKVLFYLIAYVGAAIVAATFGKSLFNPILRLVGIVFWLMSIFSMRSEIEDYASTLNPAGLSLSGVMTFFFNVAYFQYHMPEIRELTQRPMPASAFSAFGQG